MVLNEMGRIAYNEWLRTTNLRPNVELGKFVVMPNHFHGIIMINCAGRGVLHTPSDKMFDDNLGVCNTPLQSPSQTVGAIVRGYKSAVSKQLGFSVWQRNYYEHIIRDANDHARIDDYIVSNPAQWLNDKFYMKTN